MLSAVWLSVVLTASLGARANTPNFQVETSDPQLCQQIAETAETLRRDLAIAWLGKPMPDWSAPCVMTVQVGPRLGAGGATTFLFDRGEVYGWRMTIQGSAQRVLDSVLPHEITHMVFASHFRCPLPRWADEGGATTVEHRSEKDKHRRMLVEFLQTGRGIPFNQMFAMKEYPHDIMPLYAQGYSLAEFLIEQGGRPRYVAFLDEGLKTNDWHAAIRQHYDVRDLSVLQNNWLAWVRDGSQPLPRRPDATAVAVDHSAPRQRPEPNLILHVASSQGGRAPSEARAAETASATPPWRSRPMVPIAAAPPPAAPTPGPQQADVAHPQPMGNW